ncbi:uncharacterized protein LOC135469311 [Liolophura sinensis]|uniref:uncharacterized protein LOC135469311 n=1 Tax=Liolophura sinensis TaxID=3198878 RepID=UPI00315827FB
MVDLRPSEIYFTQRQINNRFKQGTRHAGYYIGQTLDDLCTGRCTVSDIPTINVMWEQGKWWTADNRRLWVFRQYERLGGCTTIPVIRTYWIDPRKKDSPNGGTSVVFSYGRLPGGVWYREADKQLSELKQTTKSSDRPRPIRSTEDVWSSLSHNSASVFEDQIKEHAFQYRGFGRSLEPTQQGQLTTSYPVQLETKFSRSNNTVYLKPDDLKYTKNRIKRSLEGPHGRTSLLSFCNMMLEGLVLPEDVAPAEVYDVFDDMWVVSGNRRLWAFKRAANLDPDILIPATLSKDKTEFLKNVRENNQAHLSLMDILTMGDHVIVSNGDISPQE